MAFPSVISADPPLGAWILTPVAPMVHIAISSHRTSALPNTALGVAPQVLDENVTIRTEMNIEPKINFFVLIINKLPLIL